MAKRAKGGRAPRRRYPNLDTYLRKTGQTQEAIALAVGISQGQVSRIVRGQMIPRRTVALRLAAYCQIPLDSFYS